MGDALVLLNPKKLRMSSLTSPLENGITQTDQADIKKIVREKINVVDNRAVGRNPANALEGGMSEGLTSTLMGKGGKSFAYEVAGTLSTIEVNKTAE